MTGEIVIATRSGMPALTMFRIALRLRSWNNKPAFPIFVHAVFQALRKSPTFMP